MLPRLPRRGHEWLEAPGQCFDACHAGHSEWLYNNFLWACPELPIRCRARTVVAACAGRPCGILIIKSKNVVLYTMY